MPLPNCRHSGVTKFKLDSKDICYACYLNYYLGPAYALDKQENLHHRFSSLPEKHRTSIGKELYKRLSAMDHLPDLSQPGFVMTEMRKETHGDYSDWLYRLESQGNMLDALAEALVVGTCTAVCPFSGQAPENDKTTPHVRYLIVAENDTAPASSSVFKKAGEIDLSKEGDKRIFDKLRYVIRLDKRGAKVLTSNNTEHQSEFQVDARPEIHAELRILEYLHLALPAPVGQKPAFYIGISKGSCAKCESVIRAYNTWDGGRFIAVNRGNHMSYDFRWHFPRGLADLKATLDYRALKNALSPS